MKKLTASISILLASSFVFLSVFILPAPAFAVTSTQAPTKQNTSVESELQKQIMADFFSATSTVGSGQMIQMPSVSVDSVILNNSSYKAGDEISGVVSVTNRSNLLLENASYRVLVGKKYEDISENVKITSTFIDATSLVYLGNIKGNESKKINFKYKIPSFISGDKLAIQINVYTDNDIVVGSNSSNYINIENGEGLIYLSDAKLVLGNDKEYNLTEGPTIYKDKDPKTAALSVKVKNKTNSEVSVIPKLSTYNQQDSDVKVNSVAPSIKLAAGESKVVSIELPNMDYKAGVYFSEVTFTNESGKQLALNLGVRYIIGGNIATVHTVQTDKEILKVGDIFNINYVVTGRPFDLSTLAVGDLKSSSKKNESESIGKISIKVFNENNKIIAEGTNDFKLTGDNRDKIELLANENARALKATVSISDENGQVFFTKEVIISSNFDSIAKQGSLNKKILTILALVLVALMALLLFSRRKIHAYVLIAVLIIIVVMIPVIVNAWVFTGKQIAGGTNMYGNVVDGAPSITVGAPYDYQTFSEGQLFNFWGYLYFISCANSAQRVSMHFSDDYGQSGDITVSQRPPLGGEAVWYENVYFVSPNLSAGYVAGLHTLRFRALNVNGGLWDWSQGYVQYNVVCSAGRVPGAGGLCSYPTNSTNTTGTNNNNSGANGGLPSTFTTGGGTAYPSACGIQANSPVKKGSAVSTSNMCGVGNNLSGSVSFNYLNNEWRWTCSGTNGSPATCKTSCESGSYLCPASNTCSSTCTDWCSNISGNQSDRSKYIVDQDGLCYEPKFIKDFKLSPSISNSQGVCKAFWSTSNPLKDGTLSCKMNGSPVSCINTDGFNIIPGITKLEAILDFASSTYTDFQELKCTKNPNLIEI